MEATHGKYTVRVLCNNEDVMDNVKILAEIDEGKSDWDGWKTAQNEHDSRCMMDGIIKYHCGAQSQEYSEGWETEVKA